MTEAERRPGGTPASVLVTPEAVPLQLELAGLGSRALAAGIDWFIQAVAGFLVTLGLAAAFDAGDVSSGVAVPTLVLFWFLVLFGYPVAQETLWRGRTVGKAAYGLRVVTTEGGPIRFRHAAIRAAMGLVDFVLTSGAAAVISVVATRKNQRLGDLVAGTLVLREKTGLREPKPVAFTVPPGLEAYAATLDVAGLSGDDYTTVRSFLLRAPALRPNVRHDLALQLARPLAVRLRPPPPPNVTPEAFLACVAAAYQHRQPALAPANVPASANQADPRIPTAVSDVAESTSWRSPTEPPSAAPPAVESNPDDDEPGFQPMQ